MSFESDYKEELDACLSSVSGLDGLRNKSVWISGATGMIGSFLVDALISLNEKHGYGIKVYASGRSEEKARKRLARTWSAEGFHFVQHDISRPMPEGAPAVDYIIHLASTTHPTAYALSPIGTVTANVFGAYNLLEYAAHCPQSRFLMASSVEIYGKNRGDAEDFEEDYCGYIDCNTLRAGYPESKRLCETLCHAFAKEKGVDFTIARIARSYGATLLEDDSKAMSQFLRKGVAKEDIVLKSDGSQFFSYTHVADAASGILTVMLKGKTGEAYNVADAASNISLRDLAHLIAEVSGVKVCFDLPSETEKAGFSTATRATLASDKVRALGWAPKYTIKDGITRTIRMMQSIH